MTDLDEYHYPKVYKQLLGYVEHHEMKVPARYFGTDLNPDRTHDCRACGEGAAWPCPTVRALTEGEPSE